MNSDLTAWIAILIGVLAALAALFTHLRGVMLKALRVDSPPEWPISTRLIVGLVGLGIAVVGAISFWFNSALLAKVPKPPIQGYQQERPPAVSPPLRTVSEPPAPTPLYYAAGLTLSSRQPVRSKLGATAMDSYAFAGARNDLVELGIVEDPSAGRLLPEAEISDPLGVTLASHTAPSPLNISARLPVDGDYGLNVRNHGSNDADYLITLTNVTSGSLKTQEGDTLRGRIEHGEVDVYQFEVPSDAKLLLSSEFIENEPPSRIETELLGPPGERKIGRFRLPFSVEISKPGTYKLIVRALGTATAPYGISLWRATKRQAGKLAFGREVVESIRFSGEAQEFTFEGVQGEEVEIAASFVTPNGTIGPLLGLFEPGGSSIQQESARLVQKLPLTGTYGVLVSPDGFLTGDYRILLTRLSSQPKSRQSQQTPTP